jgi:hypothetical protein
MKVNVYRNWWQRLIFPAEFATIGEALRYSKAIALVQHK